MSRAVFRGGPLADVEREVPDPPPGVFEEPGETDGRPVVAIYHLRSLSGHSFPDDQGRITYVYIKTEPGHPTPRGRRRTRRPRRDD